MSKISKVLLLVFITFLFIPSAMSAPSLVEITGERGSWDLTVNGESFYIKGIGVGDYLDEENIDEHLGWAKEIGANSVRRWGTSEHDNLILDKCKEYDLMAVMGFWLPVTIDYASDEYAKKMLLEQIEEFVTDHKDHPNLLMWGIGNEVLILGEIKLKEWQSIKLTDEEREERAIGFAKFLQKVVTRIHEIDSNHPVVYAGAGLTALRYIKEHAPALDVYGINFYKGAQVAYPKWKEIEADIPYIFTEFGPHGPWEVEEDINDQPIEPRDAEKANTFINTWKNYILRHAGFNFGGFAFHLTEKKLEIEGSSPTWWGLTFEGYKNASFWAMRQTYTGEQPHNYPPVIEEFTLNKIKGIRPGETIYANGKVYDHEGDLLKMEIKVFDFDSSMFLKEYSKPIERDGRVGFQAPHKEGIYRVFLFVTDSEDNITSANRSISVE
jgi:hypothetical protein